MEVGPTCHYVMGGVEVDPDTAASAVPGLFAAGEVAGGMHGSNRLGGNSLSDLLVFGRRAGAGAADYVDGARRRSTGRHRHRPGRGRGRGAGAVRPRGRREPVHVHHELQQMMNDLVGIIRREDEVREALAALEGLKERAARVSVERRPGVQPGLAPRARPAEHAPRVRGVAKAALERRGVPRRSHPRRLPDDGPGWRQVNLVCRAEGDVVAVTRQPIPPMRDGPAGAVRRSRAEQVPDTPRS